MAAGLHWLASRKSAFIFEYCVEKNPIRNRLIRQDLEAVDGYISVPEEPGLGIELDEDTVNRFRVD